MKKILFWATMLVATCVRAQTRIVWEHNYGGSDRDDPTHILSTIDGGYLLTGFTRSANGDISANHGNYDYWVLKLDGLGHKQWEKTYGGSSVDQGRVTLQTPDSGYLIGGSSSSNDGDIFLRHGSTDFWLAKTDDSGNIEWEKTYGGFLDETLLDMKPTPDGNYILAGGAQSLNDDLSANYGMTDVWVVKINPSGDTLWQKTYGGTLDEIAYSVLPTSDGGYLVGGYTSSGDNDVSFNHGNLDGWVFKIDGAGHLQWEKTLGGSALDLVNRIEPTSDGNYVILGRTASANGDVAFNHGDSDIWVIKIDAAGNILWETTIGGYNYDTVGAIREDTVGDLILVGTTNTDREGNPVSGEILIAKLTASGIVKWEQRYGGPGNDVGATFIFTDNEGLVVTGMARDAGGDVSGNNGLNDFWILKLQQVSGVITGHIFLDYNGNCQLNGADTSVANVLVFAENLTTGEQQYSFTDAFGFYQLETDTVAYRVGFIAPSPFYAAPACSPNPGTVTLSGSQQTDTLDFYMRPTELCTYLTVDVGSALLRRCFPARYHINYCNRGTATAFGASVDVQIDPILTVTGASIPWSGVAGNTYTFPVGDLDVFECGSFSIDVQVGCDSAYIGQSVCVEAHINPDTLCILGSPWSRAELKATATCINQDSVRLELHNIGAGNMTDPVHFLVIEDVIMRNEGMIQLNSHESTGWTIPVQGLTQRISAGQPSDHPYKTYTTAAVNLCNTDNLAPVPGPIEDFLTVYPNDEEEPFIAVDCQTIIGSFDPNDKSASPAGRGPGGIITGDTEISYKIRFQNTGTDTAFNIVVVDTLPQELDITTLQPGTSSHPYRLEISGNGVLKFFFNNIQLPDSNTNYLASNGFVQFSIRQKPGHPDGVVIANKADIYFDFNPAVETNTAINTIGEIYVIEAVSTSEAKDLNLRIFPNPASDRITIAMKENAGGFEVLLYDVQGRLVQMIQAQGHTVQMERQGLPSGLYGFQVRSQEKVLASGKLVFR